MTSSCLATDVLEVTQPSGNIASVVTEDTGCGGIDAPWILTLLPGSQINFTLWDFDLPTGSSGGGAASGLPSPCHVYAIIKVGGCSLDMMTSSNRNIFRVTGHLCGEFTGPGEFPAQRPVTRSFDVFFDLRLNKRLRKQS